MNRPGAHLRAFAVQLFDPSAMERLIDPVIADLQCEHADAIATLTRLRLFNPAH